MQSIILAAGLGSRLNQITDFKPKTLIEVNGKPMLGYLIDNLLSNKINDITICTGYMHENIIKFCKDNYPNTRIKFVYNPDFSETNNMYSFYLAKDHIKDDLLLMNADLVFESSVIKELVNKKVNTVVVDRGNFLIESMKIKVDSNNRIASISKKIGKDDSFGSSIDVYKIIKRDIPILINEMERIIIEENDKNQWTEVMLDNLFKKKALISEPLDISGKKWFEIDDYDDLSKAELMFNRTLSSIRSKKIFFIDRDGTLTLDNEPIKGSFAFLEKLSSKGNHFFILTNNSSKTPQEHYRKLEKLGIN